MEEQKNFLTLTILFSSDNQQSAKIDICDYEDTIILTEILDNNKQSIVKFETSLIHFYCLLWIGETICKEFNVQLPPHIVDNEKIFIQKNYGQISLKMQIEVSKFIKGCNQSLSQSYLFSYASQHIKKMQQNILKKIQIEHFKNKLKQKHRDNAGRGCLRKGTKNLTAMFLAKAPTTKKHQLFRNLNSTMEGFSSFSKSKITEFMQSVHEVTNQQLPSISNLKKINSSRVEKELTIQKIDICEKQQNNDDEKQANQDEQNNHLNYMENAIATLSSTSVRNFKKIGKKTFQQLLLTQTSEELCKQRQTLKFIHSIVKIHPISCQKRKTIKIKCKNKATASPYLLMNSRLCDKKIL